jgi:hypothetical protein
MGELLKGMYNEGFLREFGEKVHNAYSDFNVISFIEKTIDEEWEELSLKARMRRIT